MASSTAEQNRFFLLLGLMIFSQIAAADASLGTGVIGSPGSNGGSGSSMAMGMAVGRLLEALTVIFGVYYSFKAVLIYLKMASGKAQGQGENFGGMMSHFVAGVIAYHSRTFFAVVHNTVPMIPDFGVMLYDAELWRSLMS